MTFEPRTADRTEMMPTFRCTKAEKQAIRAAGRRAGVKTTADALRHIIADYFERHPLDAPPPAPRDRS